jgi:hypothetical protein
LARNCFGKVNKSNLKETIRKDMMGKAHMKKYLISYVSIKKLQNERR